LLLLYGLHPLTLDERVSKALDKVRPYLDSHGGNVDLLGITDGVVRLRMQGSCKSCPSSSMTLKLAIEEAIYAAAPDVVAIEAEGIAEQAVATGFVQIGKSTGNGKASPAGNGNGNGGAQGWEEVVELSSLTHSTVRLLEVRGRSILFCRLGESFYAYGNNCPGCGSALQGAHLEVTNLVCPKCRQQYDVIRAGRGLDQPNLHLEPFPLLFEQGRARVALPPV
jgi:Fe-S cluster biogenesis protein NfuA/nitrite reductase/ring-hydroxylating ferredoxin subunit